MMIQYHLYTRRDLRSQYSAGLKNCKKKGNLQHSEVQTELKLSKLNLHVSKCADVAIKARLDPYLLLPISLLTTHLSA